MFNLKTKKGKRFQKSHTFHVPVLIKKGKAQSCLSERIDKVMITEM